MNPKQTGHSAQGEALPKIGSARCQKILKDTIRGSRGMSNYLERQIDLDGLQTQQDTAVWSLSTLAFLLDGNAVQLKSSEGFDLETFAYGIAGMLALLAREMHVNACDISELVDQLRHEGVRP